MQVSTLSIGAFETIVDQIIELGEEQSTSSGSSSATTSSSSNQESLITWVTCLLALISKMEEAEFLELFEIRARRNRKDLLRHIFAAFNVTLRAFPATWTVMSMTCNHVILCALQVRI